MSIDSVRTPVARWRSPAKVNLCLRIVGRRPDGYHLLDSVFAPIDLCDTLTVGVETVVAGAPMRVRVRCDRPGVPEDLGNLAGRAAALLLAERGLGATMRIDIVKRIPPGSGLGGGSANAATVLRGLNAWLDLGIAPARLTALALALGADVPFFLLGRAARVRGIGEDVQPIVDWPEPPLVVAIPPIEVSTAWAFGAYAALEPTPYRGGDEAARLAAGGTPSRALLVNDLERVVLPAFPTIAGLKERLLDLGAAAAVMSGSGSAVVGVARSAADAERLAAAVRARCPGVQAYAVATRPPAPEVDGTG